MTSKIKDSSKTKGFRSAQKSLIFDILTKNPKDFLANKKSIFYTMAALSLVVAILLTYGYYGAYSYSKKTDVISTRVNTVNFFMKDVESDMQKGAFIAGFRTLLSLNQFITNNGTFIDDTIARFNESFLHGTINGQTVSLMQDSTFTDWSNKISVQARKIDINFNFTINQVSLKHTDPWTVQVDINLTLYVNDIKNTSSWKRDKTVTSKISVIGFEDPLYLVNSNGRVTNLLNPTNFSSFVNNGNPSTLMSHMNESLYIQHNDSPSFLMRLQGDLESSPYGIESLVNLDEFQKQGLVIKDRSAVDYIYFGTQTTTNYRINQTPSWFKIDEEHLDAYGVTNITI